MTFTFSEHSKTQYATLHPDLQILCTYLIQFHDFKIDVGHRGREAQNEAYRTGKSKLNWPQSKHNSTPSNAMDLLPFVNGAFIGWNNLNQWRYFCGIVMGAAAILYAQGVMKHRLRWGGDWDGDTDLSDNRFNDLPHFELITN